MSPLTLSPASDDLMNELKKELHSSQTPRPVGLRSLDKTWTRWLGIIAGNLVFFVFLVITSARTFVPILAANYGSPATAQIAGHYTTYHKGTNYYLRLFFKGQKDQPLSANVNITQSVYRDTRDGQIIPIHYLSLLPAFPAMDGYSTTDLVGSSILWGVFLIALAFQAYYWWLEYRVFQVGVLVIGRISSVFRGRNASTTVEYQWDGKTHTLSEDGVLGEVDGVAEVVLVPGRPSQARFFTRSRYPLFQVKDFD